MAETVLGWVRQREGEMLSFLTSLARMESPSSHRPSQHRILEWLEGHFRELGCYTIRHPGRTTGGYLYARYPARRLQAPVQLLLGHCDTVWPLDTLSEMPVGVQGETLAGPGTYDMKAGITQVIFALSCLRDLKLPIPLVPVVLVNSDEEIGSRESTPAIRRLSRLASRAYVMEPPLGPGGHLKTRRKGLARFTLTVYGRAAHAGLDPDKGVNAIVEMAGLVQQLYALNDFESGTTVNVGLIEGGVSPNTVAPVSRVVVDVRAPTAKAAGEVDAAIRSLRTSAPELHLEIEGGFGRPPMEATPRNQRLWLSARDIGGQLGLELKQAAAGGGSDANTTSQFTATLDGLGTPGDGAHAIHEHIRIPDLAVRTALLTMLLLLEPQNHLSP